MKYILLATLIILGGCGPKDENILVCEDRFGRESIRINGFLSNSYMTESTEDDWFKQKRYGHKEEKYFYEVLDIEMKAAPESSYMKNFYRIEAFTWTADGSHSFNNYFHCVLSKGNLKIEFCANGNQAGDSCSILKVK